MKKFSTLLLLAFFSTLAFANPSTPSNDDTASTEQEIVVTPVGFDKVLSMIAFNIETPNVEIELSQNTVGMVYKTTMRISDSEVIEMDLNDFETGTYTLKVVAGAYTTVQTIILP